MVEGLSERSVYVCVHGSVYACLVLANHYRGIIAWYINIDIVFGYDSNAPRLEIKRN